MAAVSIIPSPQNPSIMVNRRIPLSNISNATNSPVRAVAAAAKRARIHNYHHNDEDLEQLDNHEDTEYDGHNGKAELLAMAHRSSQQSEGHMFTRRANNAQPTPFERKLLASREKPGVRQASKQEKPSNETMESIRQWQRHYRRMFPEFVFYFDNIPDEHRTKFSRQIQVLGAREDGFFSKDVTHVVTTRSLPRPSGGSSHDESSTSHQYVAEASGQPKTINPLLLENRPERTISTAQNLLSKSAFTFEAPSKNGNPSHTEPESRKSQNDVLLRAQAMGMKIWALEKLQRMMTAMFETETGAQPMHGTNGRKSAAGGKSGNDGLSQLLRNERLHGPSDRDFTVASKDLVPFKGPFIYIHDMNEKTKPILVREFPKVARKLDGAWPQFRSVSEGRCPFIEEAVPRRPRESTKEKEKLKLQKVKASKAEMQPPRAVIGKRSLAEMENESNIDVPFVGSASEKSRRRLQWGKAEDTKDAASRDSQPSCGTSAAAQVRMYGGEPVASGMQKSNITSAIRSQMISSTAAAPGAKAGTSKEVHELKRKVFEKLGNQPSTRAAPSFTRNESESTSAARTDYTTESMQPPNHISRRLVSVEECGTSAEEEVDEKTALRRRKVEKVARKLVVRDPKPGYCENCRDKFDDFDKHILTRRHRKFATTQQNWAELDSLLSNLVRPHREY